MRDSCWLGREAVVCSGSWGECSDLYRDVSQLCWLGYAVTLTGMSWHLVPTPPCISVVCSKQHSRGCNAMCAPGSDS
jgi:hypothetical protein